MHRSGTGPYAARAALEPGPARPATGWLLRSELVFGALPGAVPCARLHARLVLFEWGQGGLADSVELVVSELMTNALRAAAPSSRGWAGSQGILASPSGGLPSIGLRMASDERQVLVEVWDGNPAPPLRIGQASQDSESGRGLLMVQQVQPAVGVLLSGRRADRAPSRRAAGQGRLGAGRRRPLSGRPIPCADQPWSVSTLSSPGQLTGQLSGAARRAELGRLSPARPGRCCRGRSAPAEAAPPRLPRRPPAGASAVRPPGGPCSSAGMVTELRCGDVCSATWSGQSATIDTSSGTVRPAVRSTLSSGGMIASFCTIRPVVPGRSSRIRVTAPAAASWLPLARPVHQPDTPPGRARRHDAAQRPLGEPAVPLVHRLAPRR